MQTSAQARGLERRAVAERLRDICRDAAAGRADGDAEVRALAEALAADGVVGDEADLDVRARTAVRLLERGLPRLALDAVRHGLDDQPFLTTLREGRVFVWLPGFGDPRAAVPDDVYDMSDRVVLRRGLEEVRWQGGKLVLAGFAHLSHVVAEPDDEVVLVLRRPDSEPLRVRAQRRRRPDRVGHSGQALTRLAWSGFRADLSPRALRRPATWEVAVEVSQGGVTRTAPLAPAAGSEVAELKPFDVPGPRWAAQVKVTRAGRLTAEPLHLPSAAGLLRSARRRLSRLV